MYSFRFYGLLSLLFLLFFHSAIAADEPKFYLLAEPIPQTIQLTKRQAALGITRQLILRSAEVAFTYYKIGPHAGMVSAVSNTVTFLPTMKVYNAVELEARAAWKRKKDLQEIADLTGAENIRVFTASHMHGGGRDFFTPIMDLKSLVFIEVPSNATPPNFKDKAWIPISDVDQTKVRLTLKLSGKSVGDTIDVPLGELFSGASLNPETKQQWVDKIKRWNKKIPLWDQYLTKKTITNRLAIDSALLIDGKVIPVGEVGRGQMAINMLGMSLKKKIEDTIKHTFIADKGDIGTRNSTVHPAGTYLGDGCVRYYRMLTGLDIIRTPVKAP